MRAGQGEGKIRKRWSSTHQTAISHFHNSDFVSLLLQKNTFSFVLCHLDFALCCLSEMANIFTGVHDTATANVHAGRRVNTDNALVCTHWCGVPSSAWEWLKWERAAAQRQNWNMNTDRGSELLHLGWRLRGWMLWGLEVCSLGLQTSQSDCSFPPRTVCTKLYLASGRHSGALLWGSWLHSSLRTVTLTNENTRRSTLKSKQLKHH